jgi:hypothetical protein
METMETTTKVCGKCKVEKPYGDFYKSKANKDGFASRCKKCAKEYAIVNHEKILEYSKMYHNKNRDVILEKKKNYYEKNKAQHVVRQSRYMKKMLENDPIFRVLHNIRCRVSSYCSAIRANKIAKTKEMLGVDLDCFKSYMESKFQEGMTWENYGKWHVDHIKPISLATTEQQIIELNHYTNLQPLWAVDNIKKSNKYEKSH